MKSDVFHYTKKLICEWAKEENCERISDLKIMKLLFFISSIKTDEGDLLHIFDNWIAMPYGHIEKDVLKFLKEGQPKKIRSYKNVKHSVDKLKKVNRGLVELSAFELMDLDKTYYSWQSNQNNLGSTIPTEEIRNQDKIYQL